jgi:hypothetical protein
MGSKKPIIGPGVLQWNTGAWFGSQVGGTCWILGCAVQSLIQRAYVSALLLLSVFAAANVAGTWLWHRRDRSAPFPALLDLMLVCGVAGALALAVMQLRGPWILLPGEMWALPAAVLGVTAHFCFMEWAGRRHHSRRPAAAPPAPSSSAGSLWDPELDSASQP